MMEVTALQKRATYWWDVIVLRSAAKSSYQTNSFAISQFVPFLPTPETVFSKYYVLYQFTCSRCRPERSRYNEKGGYLYRTYVEVWALSPSCSICQIIIRTFENSIGPSRRDWFCALGFGREWDFFVTYKRAKTAMTFHLYITAPDLSVKIIPVDPMSQHLIDDVRSWIDTCTEDHSLCRSPEGSSKTIPKRMIEIYDTSELSIRLCTPDATTRFTALTYCWGKTKQSSTTRQNLLSRYQNIKTDVIQKSILDAIHVTRRLGLRYLWVDSMCIIQDDPIDWAAEASKMEYIYSGALLVIAADMAEDCSDGFLQRRPETTLLESTSRYRVWANRASAHNHFGDFEMKTPTFQRAWCMQERLLANRILHFFADEVLFTCRTRQVCECSAASFSYPSSSKTRLLSVKPRNLVSRKESFFETWADIVCEFTTLQISVQSDRLPAISGLARRMLRFNSGKYLAGTWEKDLLWQLHWIGHSIVDPEELTAEKFRKIFSTPENHLLGPSFSWISGEHPVHFFGQYPKSNKLEGRKGISQITSVHCIPATTNPYGPTLEAYIKIKGPCLEGEMVWVAILQSLQNGSLPLYLDRPLDYSIDKHTPRALQREFGILKVICLGLSFETESYGRGSRSLWALLLREAADGSGYVRFGCITYLSVDFFVEHATERSITLR